MTTYTALLSEITDNMWDTSAEFVATVPDIIKRAEARLADDLIPEAYESEATSTLTAGSRLYLKPADMRIPRYFTITRADGSEKILERVSTEYLFDYWPTPSETGEPRFYADYNADNFVLAPTPADALATRVGYVQQLPPLSVSNQTNYLTDEAYNVLFYACMMEAAVYLKSQEEFNVYAQFYQRAAEQHNNRVRRADRDNVKVPLPLWPIENTRASNDDR